MQEVTNQGCYPKSRSESILAIIHWPQRREGAEKRFSINYSKKPFDTKEQRVKDLEAQNT